MRLRYQFELIQLIRNFFTQQGFLDVMTPPAVENPGMEVHIHPFQLHSVIKNKLVPQYLHTSPEFCLKQLLASPGEKIENIFSLSYCFRDEPNSPIHRNQFIMLEWYRKHALHYIKKARLLSTRNPSEYGEKGQFLYGENPCVYVTSLS